MATRILVLMGLVLAARPTLAAADGMPVRDGRFEGPVLVLRLTDPQRRELDAAATWRREQGTDWPRESEWPEIERHGLALTPDQRARLRAMTGIGPRRVRVYDSRAGENDCACGACNRALRFDDRRIEIPLEYVLDDAACARLDEEAHGPRSARDAAGAASAEDRR